MRVGVVSRDLTTLTFGPPQYRVQDIRSFILKKKHVTGRGVKSPWTQEGTVTVSGSRDPSS